MMAEEFSHTILHKNPAHVRAPLHPIRPIAEPVVPRHQPPAAAAKHGIVYVHLTLHHKLYGY